MKYFEYQDTKKTALIENQNVQNDFAKSSERITVIII